MEKIAECEIVRSILCPICGEVERSVVYKRKHNVQISERVLKFDQKVLVCNNCGLAHVDFNDDYTDENLNDYYRCVARTPVCFEDVNPSDPRLVNASRRVDFITCHTEGKSLLEIGFGDGFTLYESSMRGYDSSGVDMSGEYDSVVQFLSNKNIKIYNVDFLNFNPEVKFEIVSAFLLFEHILHPNIFLNKVFSLIADDGYFVVEVPDVTNYSNYISESQMTFEHIYHYNVVTLEAMLNMNGFELIHFDSPGAGYPFALTAAFRKKPSPKTKFSLSGNAAKVLKCFGEYRAIMQIYEQQIKSGLMMITENYRHVALFGVGSFFDVLVRIAGVDFLNKVEYLMDETDSKIDTIKFSKKIQHPNSLKDANIEVVIIASEVFSSSIVKRLKETLSDCQYYCIQDEVIKNINFLKQQK